MELICKCGNEMFNVATNKKFARCTKCGTYYNEHGEEVELKPLRSAGTVMFESLVD